MMSLKNHTETQKRSTSAFTLVELLVVISIILIASSIIFLGGSGGDGAKLSSSQRIVSGIAQGARGQAILKNADTRLIIYSENTANQDLEKKLRYFGIIYLQEDDPATPANESGWVAATQGTFLPEGIYFNPTISQNNNWTRSVMEIEYPRLTARAAGTGEEYYYYEFNSNGSMSTNFANSWLVLQAGSLTREDGDFTIDFTDESVANLKTALIFRRVGSTTVVNDPTKID